MLIAPDKFVKPSPTKVNDISLMDFTPSPSPSQPDLHSSVHIDVSLIQSQPSPQSSQVQSSQQSVQSSRQSTSPAKHNPIEAHVPVRICGYLYILCSPMSNIVKCGSTKNIFMTKQRYLNQNPVAYVMYFPVYFGDNEHLINYEVAFHNRCEAYRLELNEAMMEPPVSAKLQMNALTSNIKWRKMERERAGRHELYPRMIGNKDMIEVYQEAMYAVVCGDISVVHENKKLKFVNSHSLLLNIDTEKES